MTNIENYMEYPKEMQIYLRNYGFHFSRRAFDYAVSLMRKSNGRGGKERVTPMTKEQVDDLLRRFGVTVENNRLYDAAYVANMCQADYLRSSVPDEQHMALFVKDYLDDIDGTDDLAFRRWMITMVAKGEPVDWEEML